MASRPDGHLLAAGDDDVIFGGVVERRGLAAELDEAVGLARHGRDHDQHLIAAAASRRTRSATLRMRSIPAIEVPPNFMTMRGILLLGSRSADC